MRKDRSSGNRRTTPVDKPIHNHVVKSLVQGFNLDLDIYSKVVENYPSHHLNRNKMKKIYFLLLIVLGFYSCQKEISTEVSNTNTSTQVDVYVAGYTSDDANSPYPVDNLYQDDHPTYWKNGSPVQLGYADFVGNWNSGRAMAIAVSGNNVYVGGYGTFSSWNVGGTPYGAFWKNGIPVDDLNDFRYVFSLAVSNNDVYIAGWGASEHRATYWKNENPIALSPAYSPPALNILADATSIAVSGNDVYVSGTQEEQLSPTGGWSNIFAEYWKNGTLVKLSDGSKSTYTSSIAISGTDVYVAGHDITRLPDVNIEGVAKYWKNGVLVNLTNGSTPAMANAITVSGTDVYVAGTQWDGNATQYSDGYTVYQRNPVAKYWKNGTPVNLTDGSKWAEARSIAVSGTDVYVAGFEDGVAKYWKNGSPVILGDVSKNSGAYSIFLVKK